MKKIFFLSCLLLTGGMYASREILPKSTIQYLAEVYKTGNFPANNGKYGHVYWHHMIQILYKQPGMTQGEMLNILREYKLSDRSMEAIKAQFDTDYGVLSKRSLHALSESEQNTLQPRVKSWLQETNGQNSGTLSPIFVSKIPVLNDNDTQDSDTRPEVTSLIDFDFLNS